MVKAKYSPARRKRKKKVLKKAKGYYSDRSDQFQQAKRTLDRGEVYAYRDRKVKKRQFRGLWISRINAACRNAGLKYSEFVDGLEKAKVELDRKMLAELAVKHEEVFNKLIEIARSKK